MSDLIWLWCMGLSKFGTGDGIGQLGGLRRGTAEAHALKRPFDGPAAVGEAVEELILVCDGVDQDRASLACDDVLDQRECVSRRGRKQRTDVTGGAAVADQRHGVAARDEA